MYYIVYLQDEKREVSIDISQELAEKIHTEQELQHWANYPQHRSLKNMAYSESGNFKAVFVRVPSLPFSRTAREKFARDWLNSQT